jgi:hypothetical protein
MNPENQPQDVLAKLGDAIEAAFFEMDMGTGVSKRGDNWIERQCGNTIARATILAHDPSPLAGQLGIAVEIVVSDLANPASHQMGRLTDVAVDWAGLSRVERETCKLLGAMQITTELPPETDRHV